MFAFSFPQALPEGLLSSVVTAKPSTQGCAMGDVLHARFLKHIFCVHFFFFEKNQNVVTLQSH